MGRLRAASITLACAVGLALGVSACGGGSSELLPGKTAEQINKNLDQVRNYVAEGDCAGAQDAVGEVSEEVDGLGGVDKKLKAALREGTTRLGEVVSSCGEEALEEAEGEQEAAEQAAEQQEQEGFEAEEEELAEQKDEQKEEKAQEKAEKEAEKEQQASEKEQEKEEAEPPNSQGGEKEPPAETPSGNEPPAGGVGPGTEAE